MTEIKIIGKIDYLNKVSGKLEKYNKIEISEMDKVLGMPITGDHVYWVPDKVNINEEDEYLEPLDDPDYNYRMDYNQFRRKYGFMTPDEIKKRRTDLELTLREAAAVLGMSYSTLSNIENGVMIQSYEQEIRLQMLTPEIMGNLINKYFNYISVKVESVSGSPSGLLKKAAKYLPPKSYISSTTISGMVTNANKTRKFEQKGDTKSWSKRDSQLTLSS